jgi:hypothetical protein
VGRRYATLALRFCFEEIIQDVKGETKMEKGELLYEVGEKPTTSVSFVQSEAI